MKKGTKVNRTSSYVDTFSTSDPSFQAIIDKIRATVRKVNKRPGQKYRLRVRGRLGRNNPYAPLYGVGGPLHRYCAQEIKIKHSSRVDVYIAPIR